MRKFLLDDKQRERNAHTLHLMPAVCSSFFPLHYTSHLPCLHKCISVNSKIAIIRFEYPEDVIREAIVNALVNKDYLGSHIQMKIFEDKISLWNSGILLKGITVDELKKPHSSVHRNELISNTFYKAELIEAWGRGTTFMVDECLKVDLPEPDYREYFGGFEITLHKDKLTEKYLKDLGLNERQLKAIEHIKKNGKINNNEYKKFANVTERTILQDINELIEYKLINKHGTTKGAYYTLRMSE